MARGAHLNEILATTIVRDLIMDQISPSDVESFMIGTDTKFTSDDENRYLSLFKTVVRDRRWLMERVSEGYTFLIATKDIRKLLRLTDVMAEPGIKLFDLDVALFVVKDARIIPCTEDFLPKDLFANESVLGSDIFDEVVDTIVPSTRLVNVYKNGHTLRIMTPIVHRVVSLPLYLDWRMYHSAFGGNYDGSNLAKAKADYTYLNKNGVRLMTKAPNSDIYMEPVWYDRLETLLWIYSTLGDLPNATHSTTNISYFLNK